MKKYTVALFPVFLLLSWLTACEDSQETVLPEPQPEPPVVEEDSLAYMASIRFTEVIRDDAQPVTLTQTYQYDPSGRLTSYLTQQTFQAIEPVEITRQISFSYATHQVTLSDSASSYEQVYELDEQGYAVSCVRREPGSPTRRYQFSYITDAEGKRRLSSLTETFDDAATPYAEASLVYGEGGAVEVSVRVEDVAQQYALSFPADGTPNTDSLPCLFLTELYPFSFHALAFYARLLGDAGSTLLARVEPSDNAESDEFTTYNYLTDDAGHLTICQVLTRSYGDDYRRDIRCETVIEHYKP